MSIIKTTERRRLIITLGDRGIPSAFEFAVVNFFRNEAGEDEASPQHGTVAATAEEASAYIGAASVEHVAAINELTQRVAEVVAEAGQRYAALEQATAAKVAEITAERDTFTEQANLTAVALNTIRIADQQWTRAVGQILAPADPA